MGTVVFIILLAIAVALFLAKKWIGDKTLERWANAAAVVALIAAALVFVVPQAVSPEPTLEANSPAPELSVTPSTSRPTDTPASTSVPELIDTPTPMPTSTPTPCVCQSATDDDTLRCLIHAESQASNNDELTLIQQIFAPNVTILRGDTGEEWDNPMAYYVPTSAILEFTDARHFDIQQITITDQLAHYTSGSSGYYGAPNETATPYNNPNPSDHWVFAKDERGCWIIVTFEFNASHIDFP